MAAVYAIPFMIIAYSHVLLAIKYEFYIKIMTTNLVALEAKTINLCGINDNTLHKCISIETNL